MSAFVAAYQSSIQNLCHVQSFWLLRSTLAQCRAHHLLVGSPTANSQWKGRCECGGLSVSCSGAHVGNKRVPP